MKACCTKGMAPGAQIVSYGLEQAGGLSQGFLYTDPCDLFEDYSAAMGSQTMPPPLRAVVYYNRGLSQQKLERLAQAIEDLGRG